GQLQPAGCQHGGEQLLAASLQERHPPAPHAFDGGRVDVVDADAQAGLREGEGQGQADVATAAHDAEVEMGVRVRLQVGAESNVPEVAAARGFRSSYPGTSPKTEGEVRLARPARRRMSS